MVLHRAAEMTHPMERTRGCLSPHKGLPVLSPHRGLPVPRSVLLVHRRDLGAQLQWHRGGAANTNQPAQGDRAGERHVPSSVSSRTSSLEQFPEVLLCGTFSFWGFSSPLPSPGSESLSAASLLCKQTL